MEHLNQENKTMQSPMVYEPPVQRSAHIDRPRRPAAPHWRALDDVEAYARMCEVTHRPILPTEAHITAVMQGDVLTETRRPLPYSLAALRACVALGADAVEVMVPALVYGRWVPIAFVWRVEDLGGGRRSSR